MATEFNDMRLAASLNDLSQWKAFFEEVASRDLITIAEVSNPYPNRNSTILYRQFYTVKFNGKIPA